MGKFKEVHFDPVTGIPTGYFEGDDNCEVLEINDGIAKVRTEDGRILNVRILEE